MSFVQSAFALVAASATLLPLPTTQPTQPGATPPVAPQPGAAQPGATPPGAVQPGGPQVGGNVIKPKVIFDDKNVINRPIGIEAVQRAEIVKQLEKSLKDLESPANNVNLVQIRKDLTDAVTKLKNLPTGPQLVPLLPNPGIGIRAPEPIPHIQPVPKPPER